MTQPTHSTRWGTFQRDLALTLIGGNLALVAIEGGASTLQETLARCLALAAGLVTYYLTLKPRIDRHVAALHKPKDSD